MQQDPITRHKSHPKVQYGQGLAIGCMWKLPPVAPRNEYYPIREGVASTFFNLVETSTATDAPSRRVTSEEKSHRVDPMASVLVGCQGFEPWTY